MGPTLVAITALAAAAGDVGLRALEVRPAAVRLVGSDARSRLVVTGRRADGTAVDLTHDPVTRYECEGAAAVDVGGQVRPVADGRGTLTVRHGGRSVAVPVVVEDQADGRPVDFAAEVVPALTRRGCNAGACHGKASGRNGFRLSLLGSDPAADFDALAREGRGRRVFPARPASSLILTKPTGQVEHGGGVRLAPDSAEYRTLLRWVATGTPPPPEGGGGWASLRVEPGTRALRPGETQQLRAVASRGTGPEVDVTHLARFDTATPDLAGVDADGLVRAAGPVGEARVTARFAGLVAVARFDVPANPAPSFATPAQRNFVDDHVFARLRALGVPPSPACSDAEFARRSSLDLTGALPDPAEVAALETDQDPEKRVRWVARLLDQPGAADRNATVWSALLRNQRTLGTLSQPGAAALHDWLRQAFAENRPFDRLATDLLTAAGDPAVNPAVVWYRRATAPEELADDAAQVFLGLRLQCARCHRHPTERWGQSDYFGFASLFARVGRKPSDDPVTPRVFLLPAGLARDPATGLDYPPRVPGGPSLPGLGSRDDPRRALADWLRRPDNLYFARTAVNRVWKRLFGRGLVEPEDDFRASNPPTHPALLDALADDFVAHGYDLKRLTFLLATSRAYDRSSRPVPGNEHDRENYARFTPRRLPAEVLLDAIDRVTGVTSAFPGLPPGTPALSLPDEGFDTPGRFLALFGRPPRESACECERSAEPNLAQSLFLLNAEEVERKVADPAGRAARWAAGGKVDPANVDALYRLALARRPTPEERAACLDHLARRAGEGRLRQGYEDLVWAVVNLPEFQLVP